MTAKRERERKKETNKILWGREKRGKGKGEEEEETRRREASMRERGKENLYCKR